MHVHGVMGHVPVTLSSLVTMHVHEVIVQKPSLLGHACIVQMLVIWRMAQQYNLFPSQRDNMIPKKFLSSAQYEHEATINEGSEGQWSNNWVHMQVPYPNMHQ